MEHEIIQELAVALLDSDIPEEIQHELLEKLEEGVIQDVHQVLEFLDEHQVPKESINELVEDLAEQGIDLRGNVQNYDVENLEDEMLEELSAEINNYETNPKNNMARSSYGNKGLKGPDVGTNYGKAKRPSPFDEPY